MTAVDHSISEGLRERKKAKTRLALAVAEELAVDRPTCFVDLSPLRDPDLLPATVEQALGLQAGERPAPEAVAELDTIGG